MWFLNCHTISQCGDSNTFKDMGGYVEKGDDDVINGYDFLNSHILSQYED